MMKKDNILKVIAAALSAVLVTPFTLLFTWRKKKPEDSSESRKNKTVDELIAKYGDPDDIILLDDDLSIDGLHPDIVGKMLMAEIINMNKDKFRK